MYTVYCSITGVGGLSAQIIIVFCFYYYTMAAFELLWILFAIVGIKLLSWFVLLAIISHNESILKSLDTFDD